MTDQTQNETSERELSLLDAFKAMRKRWFGGLLMITLALTATAAYLYLVQPKFTASTTLFLDSSRAGGTDLMSSLMPGLEGDSSIESQKQIVAGTGLAIQVISDLGLNAEIEGPEEFLIPKVSYFQWRLSRRDTETFDRGLSIRQVKTTAIHHRIVNLTLRFNSSMDYDVLDEAAVKVGQGVIGQTCQMVDRSFVLQYKPGPAIPVGTEFKVAFEPVPMTLEDYFESLKVDGGGRPGRTTDLIQISYTNESPYLAAQVVASLSDAYIRLKQVWATEVSRTTSEFISSQLTQVRSDLQKTTEVLARYQKESGLLDLTPQVEAELQTMVEAELKLRESDLRLHQLKQLRGNVNNPVSDQQLFAYVDDLVLQKNVSDLQTINVQIVEMKTRYASDHPRLRSAISNRESIVSQIATTLDRYLERAEAERSELQKTVTDMRGSFAKLPDSGRLLAEHVRSTRIYEELYVSLMQEQQKARIAEAITLSDIQVVDLPVIPYKESAPRLVPVVAVGLLAGLVLMCVYVLAKELGAPWFESVEQIREAFTRPVLAQIPSSRQVKQRRGSAQIISHQPQGHFLESIRQLRTNLIHSRAGRDSLAIMLTSAMPSEGKTTIAANLACTLSRSEHVGTVLIVDADMHKPSLHSVFNLSVSPGLSDYLNGLATLDEIIRPVTLKDGTVLDVITAGPVPPMPVELIETKAMDDLLIAARKRYSFTLLDCPPYPMVTTALVMADKVDLTLSVCRLRVTHRQHYRNHLDDLVRVNKQVGIVVNGIKSTAGYGYGYGYGDQPAPIAANMNTRRPKVAQTTATETPVVQPRQPSSARSAVTPEHVK